MTTQERREQLPAYAWPGGYRINYLDLEGCVLCAECARKEEDPEALRDRGYVHWEGPVEWCEECNRELPSEYGDPEKEG